MVTKNPCKTPEVCFDDDEYDYDPCGSSEDITQKDLAVLLREEAAKLQKCKDAAAEIAETVKSLNAIQAESSLCPEVTTLMGFEDAANKLKEESLQDNKKALENRLQAKAAESSRAEETEEQGDEEKVRKKRVCKKIIKNPFFTNRLKFSTNLPPPPPAPPPQLLPLVDEVDSSGRIICPKKRKICKKKKELTCEGTSGKTKKDKTRLSETDKLKTDEQDNATVASYGKDEFNKDGDDLSKEKDQLGSDTEESTFEGSSFNIEGSSFDESQQEGYDESKDEHLRDKDRRNREREEEARKEKKRKHCKSKMEKLLCKPRVSETSISLLPPQIPPLQRDLPPTSPKDIPEVQRQILMACGVSEKPCIKKKTNKCKKK